MSTLTPARVRFAPSPTGSFHIGGARTALYNFLLARQRGGKFVLRIEDTDRKRFVPGAEVEIKESLKWLGLEWDEGPDKGGPFSPYRQSERKDIYQQHAQLLMDKDWAYPCFCSPQRLAELRAEQEKRKQPPRYDGLCRKLSSEEASRKKEAADSYVIRFKTPKVGQTTGSDLLRGPISVENKNLDDYILLKSDGLPVYHLAVVVDDHLMEISHVFRSAEWLPTFPLHVLLYEAFDWDQPDWVHLSVFLNPTGKGKMSKRKSEEGRGDAQAIYTLEMREMGYLPEAVVNWLALMGWSYDDHTEFFTMEELIQKFSLEKLNPSPAAVNYSKLDHFNGVYIRALPVKELAERLRPFFMRAGYHADLELLNEIAPIIQERIRTLEEAVEMAGFFFEEHVQPDPDELVAKGLDAQASLTAAKAARDTLSEFDDYADPSVEERLRSLADQLDLKVGQLFGIMRVAITGQRVSPPLIESMEILGKNEVLVRMDQAVKMLEELSG